MEQDTSVVKDYQKMTVGLIRDNYLNLVVGAVLLLAVLVSIGIRYGEPILATVDSRFTSAKNYFVKFDRMSEKNNTESVSKSFVDDSINYISPQPKEGESDSNQGTTVVEDGQTSSISSGQVTYQKNKYVIQPGESLQDVAQKVYGDSNAWVRIAEANGIKNPDHIEVGMELTIPR